MSTEKITFMPRKPFLIISIILLVYSLIVTLVTVYFLYLSSFLQQAVNTERLIPKKTQPSFTTIEFRDPKTISWIMGNWLTYSDPKTRIEFKYPKDWKVQKEKSDDYSYNIRVYKPDSRIKPWPDGNHQIPELNIGTDYFYSTSGALCANSTCNYMGKADLITKNKRGPADLVTKYYSPDPKHWEIYKEYYTSQFYISNEGNSPHVTPIFENLRDGQVIIDIISTINYLPPATAKPVPN